ncbi:HNH endonuclease [Agromyces sp. SYSU T00266]|uniref:HNH endonuclease n=1 Tax=Agromyces zhanjiangensis TaxID=3158562 RepID=UPI0033913A2A
MAEGELSGVGWLVASNREMFDADAAFAALGEIDWSETRSAKIEIGDLVYLYTTAPTSALTHECAVIDRGIRFEDTIDDRAFWGNSSAFEERRDRTWMRLHLRHTFSTEERMLLSLPALIQHGLRSAPQSRMRIPEGLTALIRAVRTAAETLNDAAAENSPVDIDEVTEFYRAIRDGRFSVPDRYVQAKTRGSAQRAFAAAVKRNYGYRCALTGISSPEFLVASHIVPWSQDEEIRLDPSNGICLSTLVDRAFELGFISITPDGRVEVKHERFADDGALAATLMPFDGRSIQMPAKGAPKAEYLERRRELWQSKPLT